MKTKILLPLAIVVAIGALIYGYAQTSKERISDEEGDQAITAASRVEHETNGETVVNLNLSAQKLAGLQTTMLAPATRASEVKAYGRVLDPTLLVALLSDVGSARAESEASSKEYQRLKTLFAQSRNTSAKALETAEAAMKRDQIAVNSAEARLVTAWGAGVASQPDLPAFVQSLVKLKTVLVRLDVPSGESLLQTPTGALLMVPGTNPPVAARLLGRASTTDPQVQGEGFLLVVTNASSTLMTPGLAVTGDLQLPGEAWRGVIVPDSAVVRSAEHAWVYLQTSDTTFARREIDLNRQVAEGWFVTNSIAPGDRLVVIGAQTLLSEERKTQIKLED